MSDIPDSPCEVSGIPGKYNEWRTYQYETVEWLLKTLPASFVSCLDAPTGVGKSLISLSTTGLLQYKTIYVVGTKQLQRQIEADFPNAVVIWGRDNYKCLRFADRTAADCTHKQDPCAYFGDCPYREHKRMAKASGLAVVNYSYFLTECNFVGEFSGWEMVVLDEADVIEHELRHFISLRLYNSQISECGLVFPDKTDTLEQWKAWATEAKEAVKKRCDILEWDISEAQERKEEVPRAVLDELKKYDSLLTKLFLFIKSVDETWVFIVTDKYYEWKPVVVDQYAYGFLFRHGKKFLAMSATMPKRWAINMGLETTPFLKVPFLSVPSPFPKENRPIYDFHVADFSKNRIDKNPEILERAVQAIDKLLSMHPADKGLIHTQSYALTQYVMKNSAFVGRLITHNNAEDREEVLQALFDAPGPLVLVSPSMTRGVDLCGDRAGFQIIIKVPFLDLGDLQIKRRRAMPDGEIWYVDETAHTLVQMCGRIVRSDQDKKPTYILDTRFWTFWERAAKNGSLPRWFLEAIRRVP